jgi:hypothetical protein
MERIEETLDAFAQSCSNPSLVLSYRAVADDPDAPLQELAVNSHTVWQLADPVHAELALYSALVAAVISGVDELGGELLQSACATKALWYAAKALLPGIRSENRFASRAGHQEFCLTEPASLHSGETTEDGLTTEAGLASREAGRWEGCAPHYRGK